VNNDDDDDETVVARRNSMLMVGVYLLRTNFGGGCAIWAVWARLELPPMRSPPPTFEWSITEKGEGSETRNEHTNTTASSGLGSPENPILLDIDCEEGISNPSSSLRNTP
jgi:hypothetical protein